MPITLSRPGTLHFVAANLSRRMIVRGDKQAMALQRVGGFPSVILMAAGPLSRGLRFGPAFGDDSTRVLAVCLLSDLSRRAWAGRTLLS
jgi:hypothetical protein